MKTNLKILLAGAVMFMITSCKKSEAPEEIQTPSINNKIAINSNPSLTSTIGTNVQEFNELKSSTQERDRLNIGNWNWADFDPTGFYIPANTNLQVTVEQLQGTSLPKILIGSYYRYVAHEQPVVVQLTAGINNISGGQYGGIIWVRFTNTQTPSSKVRITFNNGHLRIPVFIKNQTTQADWNNQLSTFTSPDVLVLGDRVYQVYSRTRAISYQPQDNNAVITNADRFWDMENQLFGLDGSSPVHANNVHNKIIQTEIDRAGNMWAYYYGTSVSYQYADDAFTIDNAVSWGVWHELGHLHQQKAWTWSTLGEVTNNIYSLYMERNLGIFPSRLKRDNVWPAVSAYLADTSPTKDFNNTTTTSVWGKLYMFHQLWFAFGDDFYVQLNKKARVDNPTVSTDADKMRWFMLSACTISGKNLINFFKKWGFLVNESVYTEIANLGLPQPGIEPSTLNDDNIGNLLENGATYQIVSAVNNTSVLDVNSYTPVNGTLISLWSKNSPSSNNQKFKLRHTGAGLYAIKSIIDTTKVFDVTGGFSANGTQIEVYNNNSSNNQKWAITYVGDGYYNLSPANAPNSNLDVNGGSTANGTKIQIWTKSTANSQKFKLIKQ